MSSRRHATARLLISVVATLLLLGVVAAEFPELLSLVDDTTNDFVVRKAGHGDAPTLTAPSHSVPRSEIKPFSGDALGESASGFVFAEAAPSELFLLHSVLRR